MKYDIRCQRVRVWIWRGCVSASPMLRPGVVWLIIVWLVMTPPGVVQAQPTPEAPYEFAGFVEPDFPFITTTLNASDLDSAYTRRNVAVRCLVLMLGGDTYACFDTDLLRMAVVWHGPFMSLTSMAQVSYHDAGNKKNDIPRVLGEPIATNGQYPGWIQPGDDLVDPRPAGPNPAEPGRGPIADTLGRWNGVYVVDDQAVLSYEIRGIPVAERVARMDDRPGFLRTLDLPARNRPLQMVVGEFVEMEDFRQREGGVDIHLSDATVRVRSEAGRVRVALNRYVVVEVEPGVAGRFRIAVWKEDPENGEKPFAFSGAAAFPDYKAGGGPRWPEPVVTRGRRAPNAENPYVVDELTLPLPNPWRRNVRLAGLDFFDDGRAAVSTFEGDVWIVDGIDATLDRLEWKRFASGLYEPMSLSIVDDRVYVFGREGIIRFHDINQDGEADYYENFSNVPVQTGESREFPTSMHPEPGGGFYVAKGAAQNSGPKTNPAVMNGFRAGGPHSGSILHVSADGRSVSRYATGLRMPYMGVHPDKGWVTASDQQGHFVPSTPIYLIREGDYFGVPATAHRVIPPDVTPPLTWAPHQLDRSGTEQVWVTSDRFGPLSGALIHLSYGKPAAYRVYMDSTGGVWQGAIAELPVSFSIPLMEGQTHPVDGQLYLTGFQVWDSSAEDISGLVRVRYTGSGALPVPAEFAFGREGLLVTFDRPIDRQAAEEIANYSLERWNYRRTEQYGSGHFQLDGTPGQERVRIVNAARSTDRTTVFLQIDDMQPVMQMALTYRLQSEAGDSLSHSLYFSVGQLHALDLQKQGFRLIEKDGKPLAKSESQEPRRPSSSVEEGKRLYQQIGCIACHSADGSSEGRSGPTFQGLWGRQRTFADGTTTTADNSYVTESILQPDARVVAGYEVEMPSYQGILDEQDIASITLFIRSLNDQR